MTMDAQLDPSLLKLVAVADAVLEIDTALGQLLEVLNRHKAAFNSTFSFNPLLLTVTAELKRDELRRLAGHEEPPAGGVGDES